MEKGVEFCSYPKSGNLLLDFPAASLDSSEINMYKMECIKKIKQHNYIQDWQYLL